MTRPRIVGHENLITSQARWLARRDELGLCMRVAAGCNGKRVEGKRYCASCASKMTAGQKVYRQRKKEGGV